MKLHLSLKLPQKGPQEVSKGPPSYWRWISQRMMDQEWKLKYPYRSK